MQIEKILAQLRAERNRLDRAIAALQGVTNAGGTRTATKRPKRRITAAGRKRLSELLKKRWASGKMRRARKTTA